MSVIKEGLLYARTHEWVSIDGETATVGVSDFAQKQLTDVVYVDLPDLNRKVFAGKPMLTVESVKSAEDVFSPVDGTVIEVNRALDDKPELINRDPYNSWLVKIRLDSKPSGLMSPEEYRKFIGE
ncbi:MAG: glycine cleavage system protein GcvH [Candidatus Thermoplasmatota archaeon]|jgi:glycine cleavage system H protein|nr:glycine cleavage system protein GcvH [Candidatus Thermoplasmatota archaeon]